MQFLPKQAEKIERYLHHPPFYDSFSSLFGLRLLNSQYLQGVPKKIWFKPIFEFLTLRGVFLGVKNNSKNFGNKKNIWLFSKILSKWTLYYSKSSDLLNLYDFVYFQMSKNHSKSYKICYLHTCMHKY